MQYFFTSFNTLWSLIDVIVPCFHYLWNDIDICFSCSIVNISKDFFVIAVAREKSMLVPVHSVSTSRQRPPANMTMKTSLVINVEVIRPLYKTLWSITQLNSFIFLVNLSRTSVSLTSYTSITVNFFKWYVWRSCVDVGFKSG